MKMDVPPERPGATARHWMKKSFDSDLALSKAFVSRHDILTEGDVLSDIPGGTLREELGSDVALEQWCASGHTHDTNL
jgi:hypothetical protein